jgi:negative regulator of sigma E activity
VRTEPPQPRAAARPGGSTVTSAAVLLLFLAPALIVVTGAEALPLGQGSKPPRAQTGLLAAGAAAQGAAATERRGTAFGPGGTGYVADDISAPHAPVRARTAGAGGLPLLYQAAVADRYASYEGVQIISWWSPDGTTTVAVNVIHGPRQGTLLQTMGGPTPDGQSFMAHEPGAQPGDVLGVTEETLDLLSVNYQVVAAGSGSACNRPATVVEALRGDGTVAGKFWLDNATKITLRRELFDHQSRMVNETTFIDLNLDSPAAAGTLRAQRGSAAARPWDTLTSVDLATMRAKGWPVPAELPSGLVLFDARQAMTRTGRVIQLGYSDGLSGMSLFLQRGGLPHRLAGWREVEVGGRAVYARNPIPQGLTWSSHGYVLTLIANAPATTIGAVVQALPHDGQRGFWSRLRHGFWRVVSWIDPFG